MDERSPPGGRVATGGSHAGVAGSPVVAAPVTAASAFDVVVADDCDLDSAGSSDSPSVGGLAERAGPPAEPSGVPTVERGGRHRPPEGAELSRPAGHLEQFLDDRSVERGRVARPAGSEGDGGGRRC
jgi:hypothetical protein